MDGDGNKLYPNMILNRTVLVLEDDLEVLSLILGKLAELEGDQPFELSTVVITNHIQVQELINPNRTLSYDIVLLDRDCKLGGSFHVLDIERIGPEKIIGISSVPKYNEEAVKRGVSEWFSKILPIRKNSRII